MAQGKNSFILYADYLHVIGKLPDDKAGKLFKHILEYVNDMNPVTDDILIEVAFEPIKRQLKRDLKDWEQERQFRSNTGKLGGLKSGESRRKKKNEANEAPLRKTKLPFEKRSSPSKNEANEAVNVTVNDTVNVNDNKKINYLRFRDKIFQIPVSQFFKENFQVFLESFEMHNKDVPASDVLKKMDEDYICHTFNNENHLQNSFRKTYNKLKNEKNKTTTVSKADGYKKSAVSLLHKRGINPADHFEPAGTV